MGLGFKAFWEGIRIKAKAALSSDTLGELESSNVTNKVYLHNGTSRSPIVTADHSETLTNKTIDADDNTISDLEVDNLKAGVLNTSTTLAGATDLQVPSALAAKTYIEDLAGAVQDNLDAHITDPSGAHAASAISVTPVGNLIATDAQAALAELDSDITTVQTNLTNHINDTIDAHDASAISVVAIPGVTGDDVQEVLEDLKSQIDNTSGDVTGPASSTDNAIARFDGTTGKVIQNSAVSISDAGAITNATIDAGFNAIVNITDSSIANFAGIDASKIADASVSNTEFQYLDGVTSSIQTQLNGKQNLLVNSAGLAAALSDETGNGLAVFNNQPTITNASIQTPSRLDAKQDTLANLTTYALTATNGQFVFSTDTKETFVVKDGQLSSVAGSNSGGINYIINYTADTNTNGWVAYADAAGTSPADGTGGTPASTYTRSTSAPLRGTASFVWTKSAANRQGEGFSYDFTIDSADTGKVLQGYFDYQISSGTFADNDMSVWIYDVTNARLIQPAPYLLKNSGIIERFPFEFQTAINSTSYRLIVHTGSTSALAYTLKFDNFNVGPQAKLYGSAVTDWVSYTPTFTGFTSTTNSFRWKRDGDTILIEAGMKLSSVAASAASFTLPAGLSLNGAKQGDVNAGVAAAGEWNSSSAAGGNGLYGSNVSGLAFTDVGDPTKIFFSLTNNTDASNNVVLGKANGSALWTATANVYIRQIKIPIQGWSSSQVMSSDANTRVVAAIVSGQPANVSANNPIIFPTVFRDTHGSYSTVTGKYTASSSGYFDVIAYLDANIAGGNGFYISVNNNTSPGANRPNIAYLPNANTPISGSGRVYLNAGDTLDIRPSAAATFTNNVNTISISMTNGPAQIAASETVAALYTGAPPTGTLNSSFNITTFGTRVKDTHNAYSGGTYTIPSSGLYSISASVIISATRALNNDDDIAIFIDGTIAYQGNVRAAGAVTTQNPKVSVESIPLLAGQLVTIRSASNATTPSYSASAQLNFFSIVRTGNY